MSWKPAYGLLLFAVTFIDWILALWMEKFVETSKRKMILVAGIVVNLGALIFFKYFDFISVSLWGLFSISTPPLIFNIILPIGISFYIFQSTAYMIDIYRRKLPPEKNLGKYAAFVSFFPHLISGPILIPSSIIPQLHEKKEWKGENIRGGLFLIGVGLIKKVVIADSLSFLVNTAYYSPAGLSGATLLLATYFFAFQLYCDFSGYTDIAIGSAKVLGYQIPDNFRQPYFSKTIAEFWRRWHISLSTWFRDYFYYPLAFTISKYSKKAGVYLGILITFFVVGLWHGAGWTYILMGSLFGFYIVIGTTTQSFRARIASAIGFSRFPFLVKLWKIFFTFNLVSFAWIFFRADSIHTAFTITKNIFVNFGRLDYSILSRMDIFFAVFLIVTLVIFDAFESKKSLSKRLASLPWYYQMAFAYVIVLILMVLGVQQGPRFIYFQF
ncbi:MAG: MBOAT family O-acyltransferase [Patescibacteria group bacterium]